MSGCVEFPGAGGAPERAVQEREGPDRLREGESGQARFRHQRRGRVHSFTDRGFTYLYVPQRRDIDKWGKLACDIGFKPR
jgi:hypothetical protein